MQSNRRGRIGSVFLAIVAVCALGLSACADTDKVPDTVQSDVDDVEQRIEESRRAVDSAERDFRGTETIYVLAVERKNGNIVYVLSISDEEFEKLIGEALDTLPEKYVKGLDNVLITYEDEPTPAQREELKLHCNQTLFGLYQGIPRTARNNGYNMVVPDKITIFKNPMLHFVHDLAGLKEQIRRTVWHEIAHHYGLDHDRIHALE